MTGKAKAVSDEYKSALVDLTFNSKPMINLLTMLAEENNDYAQCIVNVICDRIKQVVNEQKMPALYLLDSILKNIGKEYVAIISKHIVDVFCCVFETAPDEHKRKQLFRLRNTWNQYIPTKTLYDLDVRITRTDPNWPVAAPVVTTTPASISSKQVIHVNPKFLKTSDPTTATTISATLAASIVAEKEASKLQSKINKQRLLEEEKRVQEQLRILQADKIKRDREQHELVLRRQQQERERVIAEQKRQLEVLRKQQRNMTDASSDDVNKGKSDPDKEVADGQLKDSKSSKSGTDKKTKHPDGRHSSRKSGKKKDETSDTASSDGKPKVVEGSTTKVIPNISPLAVQGTITDPRLKNDALPNDPRVNRNKSKTKKSAVNVMNKIMGNLSTKKGQPEEVPQSPQVRKIRPYVNPLYARSPVCIATASQSFASSSYSTLNLSIPKERDQFSSSSTPSPVSLHPSPNNLVTIHSSVNENLQITSTSTTCVISEPNRNYNVKKELPVCTVVQSHNTSIMQSPVSSSVTITQPSIVSVSSQPNVSRTSPDIPSTIVVSSSAVVQSPAMDIDPPKSTSCRKIKAKQSFSTSNTQLKPVVVDETKSRIPTLPTTLNSADMHMIQPVSSSTPTISIIPSVVSTNEVVVVSESQLSTSNTVEVVNAPKTVIPESAAGLPPPFSGAFKNLSSRDMQIAAQAAAIATAMHQMQVTSGGIAPEQSAQLAAQLIEIMHGAAAQVSSAATSAVTTTSTISTSLNSTMVSDSKLSDNKKKENQKVREINEMINRERSARSSTRSSGKEEESKIGMDGKPGDRIRERSPHDFKRETRQSRQKSVEKDNDKEKSPEKILRSRTRERDKDQVILGEEPPSKKSKESSEMLKRGHKASARAPWRYSIAMERKIESEKRVEEKGKELVLERIRKVSEGDPNEHSKMDKENVKDRKSPTTVTKQSDQDNGVGMPRKEFISLKERLYDLHKKIEKTGNIDQEMFTKIMAEVDHKTKEGILHKEQTDQLMMEIHYIRRESKHKSAAPKEKLTPDAIPPNEHLHWRSRKDLSNDIESGGPVGQSGPSSSGGPRPMRPNFPNRPTERFPAPHPHETGPRHRFDGPPPLRAHYMRDGPPPPPERPPRPPHMNNEGPDGNHSHYDSRPYPPNTDDGLPPRPTHMDAPHPHQMDGPHSHMIDGAQPHGPPRPPYPHHLLDGPPPPHLDGPQNRMIDGPRPPHMMDGPRPPHLMDGPGHPRMMNGPRPPHMMDGPRPPHLMDGPGHPHMMDGPRPPHMMDGPRPPNLMDGPRPPHMMDGPRPPHMMDGPRPPHMMDGPRPPHMMDGPRQPHMMDGPRPPHLMDGPRPSHFMDGPRPPHMMDGPLPPNMMEGPRPPHMMDRMEDRPRPPNRMDGSMHHMGAPLMDGPYPSNRSDGIRPQHMDGSRPPYMTEGPRAAHPRDGSYPPHFDASRRPEGSSVHQYPGHDTHESHSQHWGHNQPTYPVHSYNNTSSQPWTSSLTDSIYNMLKTNDTAPGSSTSAPTFDVSTLLGQLTAAGLLPKSTEREIISEPSEAVPEPKENLIPEFRLLLDDLRVRCDIVIDGLFGGMQCSSCGERFPSDSLNQYRDHLDWHFRQNRRGKEGVRKGCRAWYFSLNEWVEQTTYKPFEVTKAQSAIESETKEEEKEEVSHAEEGLKLVEDNSIPVGETAGDLCHVCMDPLEQYWDEDREEWRYRKAVRENNKTYHYHCFVDYVPFEEEEEYTPPETPSFPLSPTLVRMDDNDDNDGPVKKEEEMEVVEDVSVDVSAKLNTSATSTELNSSTEYNPNAEFYSSTLSELNTSQLNASFIQSRLTISMMEVLKSDDPPTLVLNESIKPEDTNTNVGKISENIEIKVMDSTNTTTINSTNSVTTKKENTTVPFKNDNDVISTLQDILRVASSTLKIKTDVAQDTETVASDSPKRIYNEINDSQLQIEIEDLLAEILDKVEKATRCDDGNSETEYLLPGSNLSSFKDMSNTDITCPDNAQHSNISCKEGCTDTKVNAEVETEDVTSEIDSCEMKNNKLCKELPTTGEDEPSKMLNLSINSDCDKKELHDDDDVPDSPYIENLDSPVYPVITSSNLACIDDDSILEIDDDGYPITVVLPTESTLRCDVNDAVEYLVSKVTINSDALSFNTQNLGLCTDGLSLVTMEPSVSGIGCAEGDTNNIAVDG